MIEIIKSVFLSPRGTVSSKRLTGFLMITLAGFLIALGIMCVIFIIIGALKANNKEIYKYPLSIKFLK